jgi:glutathione S-transferase
LEQELTQFLGKALYTGEKSSAERLAAWSECRNKIDVKLKLVEEHLKDKTFLGGGTSPLAADFAVATITWIMSLTSLWGPKLLADFPVLEKHLAEVKAANPSAAQTFDEMAGWEPYYILEKSD